MFMQHSTHSYICFSLDLIENLVINKYLKILKSVTSVYGNWSIEFKLNISYLIQNISHSPKMTETELNFLFNLVKFVLFEMSNMLNG